MENSNPILNELKALSPVVAAIGQQPTYIVPQGYFDGLAMQLMLRIAVEEKTGTEPVIHISKENVYELPQDYFEGLAGTIMNRIKAEETKNPKEELELLSPLLGQVGRKMPFATPDGYFNDIADNLIAGVKAIDFVNEELENLSPTMNGLKNKQVYEVPAGYFETSANVFLEKAKQQQPAKLISMGADRKIMRYAAAAVIAGLVVLAGFMYSGNSKPQTGTSQVPELAKVTDQEMENFLNTNTAFVADTSTIVTTDALDEITEKDSKDLLANVSDEELQQYAADQHIETPIIN
ncbi:MAG: hypothetical protein ABIQ88_04845 [Chitinophagaceae bacterium]